MLQQTIYQQQCSTSTAEEWTDLKRNFCTQDVLKSIKDAKTKLINADIYPNFILEEIETYVNNIDMNNDDDAENLKKPCAFFNNIKCNNLEKFYILSYDKLVNNSNETFKHISCKSSSVLMKATIDKIVSYNEDFVNDDQDIITKNLSNEELAGLQYLGGYVLQKLHKKIKNSKNFMSDESQQILSILEAGRGEPNENFELINVLDRGGLWYITKDMEKILIVTEKFFCIQTVKLNLTKCSHIPLNTYVSKITRLSQVNGWFEQLVSNVEISVNDIARKKCLYMILNLYLRIRSYTFAQDVIQKYRITKKQHKKKGLRKEISKNGETST